MPIATVETRRLYQQIAAQLSALIASGEFAVGQRLPSERELAVQLGVSRPSLREALIALELEGLVEVRVGAGIWVTAASARPPTPAQQEGEGPFELLRARWLIEGEVAAAAAREATAADLTTIRAALAEMERLEKKHEDFSTFDREFHLRVAASTHNGVLQTVVEDLWDRGRGAMWRLMEQHFRTPALQAATVADHRAIYQALAAHDPREARNAMRAHLKRVDSEFARGWDLVKGREGAASGGRPARKSARRSATR
ncbi:MAG TPA: FadR/GntR family transcriptional regulator [Kofleriaceae bacterium]|jgi:DNA-binding FadR family transcriptional regulator|nr:FadR/GntR family transcriptional regulator [Kofleriaceae bacterium]